MVNSSPVAGVPSLTTLFNVECLELAGEIVPEKTVESEGNTFRQVLRTKAVHLMAFFIFIYVGVEVTIGGTTKST